jgi:hypothetical protein
VTSTVGLDLDSVSCREVIPARGTSRRATGLRVVMVLLALVVQINRTRSFARDRTRLWTSWRRRSLLLLRWFNKAKMTWSPARVFRCRLVRGFEGFGQVLLLVGEQMAVSVDGDLDA